MKYARDLTSEFGGVLETIKIFHQIWYGTDCVPQVNFRWITVLSFYCKKESEKVEVGDKGFKIVGAIVRRDGSIERSVPEYIPGDPSIFEIVDRLFGYAR